MLVGLRGRLGFAGAAVLIALLAPAGTAGAATAADSGLAGFILAKPARPVPPVAFVDAGGRKRHLAEFRGNAVLLVFWAVWCPACQAELPALDRLATAFEGEDFRVLAVARQSGDATTIGRYLDSRGLDHLAPFVDPGRRLGLAFRQHFFPTAILIDRGGHEVGRAIGPAGWDSAAGRAIIRRLLNPANRPQSTGPGEVQKDVRQSRF